MTIQSAFEKQPIEGITGYREVKNLQFEPHFSISIPSNWNFSYNPIPKEKTNWIALGGPWNEEAQRNSSLSIMVKEDWHPEKTLDESAEHSIIDKMVGEWAVLYIRPATLAGLEAREVKTKCRSMNPFTAIFHDDLHQWVIFRHGKYTFTIHYSSSERDFETYFEAYTKAIESFTFIS